MKDRLRILVLSALYPPNMLGGAEMSAANLVKWMVSQGAEVGLITTAASEDDVLDGEVVNGVRMWRIELPRPYPTFKFPTAAKWLKPLWHFQDHFDPRNRWLIRRIIRRFKPALCNIHVLQGIGYNVLKEFANFDIPVTYFQHDLGLACIKMSMFRNGHDCVGQCASCKVSSAWKHYLVDCVPRIGFCSPSRANLQKLSEFFPLGGRPQAAILNANRYPPARVERMESERVRILYVGRLHSTKGVRLLLDAADQLADRCQFDLTVIGNGPEEQALRERFEAKHWCKFTGFLSQEEISDYMVNSDVLCIPSIWAENSPGVVVHALGLGLPVIGSKKGGIPELIDHGRTGMLVEPGNLSAWRAALACVVEDRAILREWRTNALAVAKDFDQAHIGKRIMEFMEMVANGR